MKQGRVTISVQGIIDELTAKASASVSYDLTGKKVFANDQNIGTVAEALNFGDITTVDHLYVENLDATNYVQVDSANTFDKFPQKIIAGDPAKLAPQTATIYAKANTAACVLRVVAIGS